MEEKAPDFSNSAYLLPHVNREGVRFGTIALILAFFYATAAIVVAHFVHPCIGSTMGLFVVPGFLLAYGVFLFFRDPERYPPKDENAILSPADGRVCLVQEVPLPDELDGKESEKFWRVSVFMSVFDVHVNRAPTAATVVKKAYVPGKFLNASLDKASKDNERCAYLMRAEGGQTYGVVQIAGLVAKRIVPFVEEGAKLARAERFGLIRFGSRLDVYLPAGVKPEVRVGQTMRAGETVLGHLAV